MTARSERQPDQAPLLGWLGGHSIPASLCAVGSDRWVEATIVELTAQSVWLVARHKPDAGRTLLCKGLVGDRILHLVIRRTDEAMRFDLVEGSFAGVEELLPRGERQWSLTPGSPVST